LLSLSGPILGACERGCHDRNAAIYDMKCKSLISADEQYPHSAGALSRDGNVFDVPACGTCASKRPVKTAARGVETRLRRALMQARPPNSSKVESVFPDKSAMGTEPRIRRKHKSTTRTQIPAASVSSCPASFWVKTNWLRWKLWD
jgi:hypothetical protein